MNIELFSQWHQLGTIWPQTRLLERALIYQTCHNRKIAVAVRSNFAVRKFDPEKRWLNGEGSSRFEVLSTLCPEFKIVHHCNWKNFSKPCTTHIKDYLDLLNHSCHGSFGKFNGKSPISRNARTFQ